MDHSLAVKACFEFCRTCRLDDVSPPDENRCAFWCMQESLAGKSAREASSLDLRTELEKVHACMGVMLRKLCVLLDATTWSADDFYMNFTKRLRSSCNSVNASYFPTVAALLNQGYTYSDFRPYLYDCLFIATAPVHIDDWSNELKKLWGSRQGEVLKQASKIEADKQATRKDIAQTLWKTWQPRIQESNAEHYAMGKSDGTKEVFNTPHRDGRMAGHQEPHPRTTQDTNWCSTAEPQTSTEVAPQHSYALEQQPTAYSPNRYQHEYPHTLQPRPALQQQPTAFNPNFHYHPEHSLTLQTGSALEQQPTAFSPNFHYQPEYLG